MPLIYPRQSAFIRVQISSMLRVEFHCHTIYSKDSLLKPEKLVALAQARGIDRLVVTDHNTIEGALRAQSISEEYGIEVVIGEEVSSREGHVIGLYLQDDILPGMSATDTIQAIEEQGGIAVIPHPFSNKGVFGPRGRGLFAAAAAEGAGIRSCGSRRWSTTRRSQAGG